VCRHAVCYFSLSAGCCKHVWLFNPDRSYTLLRTVKHRPSTLLQQSTYHCHARNHDCIPTLQTTTR
jgi:hypothetical protein